MWQLKHHLTFFLGRKSSNLCGNQLQANFFYISSFQKLIIYIISVGIAPIIQWLDYKPKLLCHHPNSKNKIMQYWEINWHLHIQTDLTVSFLASHHSFSDTSSFTKNCFFVSIHSWSSNRKRKRLVLWLFFFTGCPHSVSYILSWYIIVDIIYYYILLPD